MNEKGSIAMSQDEMGLVGDAFQARAATPSGLSRFASSCQHRIAIAKEKTQ
jgi:hypothetical protein